MGNIKGEVFRVGKMAPSHEKGATGGRNAMTELEETGI